MEARGLGESLVKLKLESGGAEGAGRLMPASAGNAVFPTHLPQAASPEPPKTVTQLPCHWPPASVATRQVPDTLCVPDHGRRQMNSNKIPLALGKHALWVGNMGLHVLESVSGSCY